MKKKLYSAVLALFLSVAVADAKVVLTYNIDYMDKAKTLSELIPEEEKYTVDSITQVSDLEFKPFEHTL